LERLRRSLAAATSASDDKSALASGNCPSGLGDFSRLAVWLSRKKL
jgi:hypothetical protein